VILTAVFPRDQNPNLAPTIAAINSQLESLADGKRIRFVNINDQLTDAAGKLLSGISNDGLHLEQPGYEIWSTALRPVLEEILGPPAEDDHAPPATGDPKAVK
jgi:lysophospholipase L1-like esterase